ncbi:MAG TPA: head GIN domain-containing protein [Ferruginibacter sp.]|nr:head GIN domain-containing protein [Ferruginibacter sp.]HMP21866.1 head GIN domain-containing protein [Ferruginibacter sp.]
MKKLFLIVCTAVFFASCDGIHGSGNIVTEKRNTGSFRGISTGGAYDVELSTGPYAVEVEADDNVIKYISTRVDDGILEIKKRGGLSLNNSHVKIYVSAPDINYLRSSGAANIRVKDILNSDKKITLKSSGAAGIEAAVDAPEIDADASGAATIKLKGRTRDFTAEASGSAAIKSSDLLTENTTAKASGAADIKVHASVQLDARASGAANIHYNGEAAVKQHTSGAASIKKTD